MPNSPLRLHCTEPQGMADIRLADLREGHTQAAPKKNWLFDGGGREHVKETDTIARSVIRAWTEAPSTIEAGKAGNGGCASYAVHLAERTVHLKIPMPPASGLQATPTERKKAETKYHKLCATVAGEGERSRWAGQNGVGPRVHHLDAPTGAIVTDFIFGHTPSRQQIQLGNLYYTPSLAALATLHAQDATSVPEGGSENWLLSEITAQKYLVDTKLPEGVTYRSQAFTHALLQCEQGLLKLIDTFPPAQCVPIHNDFHPLNTLADAHHKINILDWQSLRVGHAAIDLGHFSAMGDVGAAALDQGMVTPYFDLRRGQNSEVQDKVAFCSATHTYAAMFRMRNAVFFDQWRESGVSGWLFKQFTDDIDGLASNFRAIGLRPIAPGSLR